MANGSASAVVGGGAGGSGGSLGGPAALQLLEEEALRDAARGALRESGLYIKEEWVRDFLTESVVVELQEGGLPAGAEEAHGRFAQLVFDNLSQAEPDEVRDFAAALHRLLAAAVEAVAAGGGSSEDEGRVGGCAMCGREMPLTFHHLIPRETHDRYKKRGMSTAELATAGIDICRPCHSAIHRTYDNKTLAASFYSLELLLQSEPLQKFIAWARKQKVTARADAGYRYRR